VEGFGVVVEKAVRARVLPVQIPINPKQDQPCANQNGSADPRSSDWISRHTPGCCAEEDHHAHDDEGYAEEKSFFRTKSLLEAIAHGSSNCLTTAIGFT
jgi:hypothetical protein